MDVAFLGPALVLLRRRIGLLQVEAAQQVREATGTKVTPTRISNWENGKSYPSINSLFAYLKGLGYHLGDLYQAILAVASGETDPFAEFLAQGRRRLRDGGGAERDFEQSAIQHLGGEALAGRLSRLERRLATVESHCGLEPPAD